MSLRLSKQILSLLFAIAVSVAPLFVFAGGNGVGVGGSGGGDRLEDPDAYLSCSFTSSFGSWTKCLLRSSPKHGPCTDGDQRIEHLSADEETTFTCVAGRWRNISDLLEKCSEGKTLRSRVYDSDDAEGGAWIGTSVRTCVRGEWMKEFIPR